MQAVELAGRQGWRAGGPGIRATAVVLWTGVAAGSSPGAIDSSGLCFVRVVIRAAMMRGTRLQIASNQALETTHIHAGSGVI